MSRQLAVSWRSARFGLRMVHLGCLAVAYLSLVLSIVEIGMIPFVLGREVAGIAGFAAVLLLGAVFLGVLRGGWHAQVDYFRWLVCFIAGAVLVYLMSIMYPAALERLLSGLNRITPYVLHAAFAATLLGIFYCLTAWGSLFTWLAALLSFVTLAGSLLFMLAAEEVAWATPWIPALLRESWPSAHPAATAVALACVAIYCHAAYLKNLARCVQDAATRDYVDAFQRFHWIGSAIILAALIWGSWRTVKPVLTIGSVNFDSFALFLGTVKFLVIAIEGIWLGRCVAGVGDLINPYRGHGVGRGD